MKRLFSLLVLALSFSAIFAQQTTVALLNHEGTITTYYGSEALVQAHKAAVHGDVITLSGGTFNAPSEWVKAVTLRGAGCYQGADNSHDVTYINGTFVLHVPNSIETATIIEGINFNTTFRFYSSRSDYAKNTTFLKCYFYELNSVCLNTNFYNCIIEKISFSSSANYIANINMFNCYTTGIFSLAITNCSIKLINCIVFIQNDGSASYKPEDNIQEFKNTSCSNCIFVGNIDVSVVAKIYSPSDYNLDKTCTAKNCLSCFCAYTPAVDTDIETKDAVYDYNIFDNMGGNAYSNWYLTEGKPVAETIKSVFKTYNGVDAFSFNEFFELTDEAKTTYIGSDGTQIGIHGGIGFDLIPSTLQITKCEVAPRSTSDGKLSVSIEVGIPE